MKKIERRILFYGLAIVFLVITPLVLAYSFGYSFDQKSGTVIATGGIFIKTNQTAITISISGGEKKQTSFLASGALFSDLPEGTYAVTIEKNGFRQWKKQIPVIKQTVSEYRGIYLIPEKINLIKQFSYGGEVPFAYAPSTNGSFVAFVSAKKRLLMVQSTDTGAVIFSKKLTQSTLPKNLRWTDDASLLWDTSGNNTLWDGIRISQRTASEFRISITGEEGIEKIIRIVPHPITTDIFYVLTKNNILYLWDKKTPKTPTPVLSQVIYFAVTTDNILFINETGFFASADLSGENISSLGRPGFSVTGEFDSVISPQKSIAIRDGFSGLFYYVNVSRTILPLTGGINEMLFNQEEEKLLGWGEHSLSVIFLEKEKNPPFREIYAREKIVETKKPVVGAAWYQDEYILFSTDNGIFGAEFGEDSEHIVQKLSDEKGYLFVKNTTATLINEKGVFRFTIE